MRHLIGAWGNLSALHRVQFDYRLLWDYCTDRVRSVFLCKRLLRRFLGTCVLLIQYWFACRINLLFRETTGSRLRPYFVTEMDEFVITVLK